MSNNNVYGPSVPPDFKYPSEWPPKPMKKQRIYEFDLPYHMSGLYVYVGYKKFKKAGLLEKLPNDLRVKFEKAAQNSDPITISKYILDQIDDDTWTKIASDLSLKWHYV